ncbi:hypothetical protein PR003_g7333 [Phytophthora rubi]|uniref:Uncharacterized protein n=1 Tax=Phytophthora rubi TaxID=129364 RepID=A0A6A3NBI2_9STRA|nr:hypothetical protein PR002_g7268 [Phytophthora rubi]KAE9040959.1 hypothetical protein PR001_g6845 [Phytophthora rubi]KAE9346635.1 hypothetical protein PR003_g7333 [Phytophthora rubi]
MRIPNKKADGGGWCRHLSWRLRYVKGALEDSPELRFRGIEVELPSFGPYSDDEEEAADGAKSPCQDVREALALLAALAHVDKALWTKLLVDHVKLDVREEFEGEILPRFQLALVGDGPDGDGELLRGIAEFCGTEQYTAQSAEYKKALAAVAAMNGEKSCKGSTEIEVPITVQLGPWLTNSSDDMFAYLRRVQETVRNIRAQWQQNFDWGQGPLSVAFVLESIMVDLRDVSISAELAELVESLAEDGIRVSGLALRHELGRELTSNGSLGEARLVVGRLVLGLFGGAARAEWGDFDFEASSMTGPLVAEYGHANQLEFNSVHFDSEAIQNWVFDRICSAVAVSQTTKQLSLDLELEDGDDDGDGDWALCRWRWQWIIFACFSEKARLHSRLESLTLRNAVITTEAVKAMAEVLASGAPEEALLGLASQYSEPAIDVCIEANSTIKLLPMYANEVFDGSKSFIVERVIAGVRELGECDENNWVDVLVPGFGKCQVQRSRLTYKELALRSNGLAGVTSLAIKFDEDPDPRALEGLLILIGASLTHLTLEFEEFNTNDLAGIVASCPNLAELAVCTHTIEMRFCLHDINYRDLVLDPDSHFSLSWGIEKLAGVLSDSENPLTKCARRLRVRMDQRSVAHSYDECYAALLAMLEMNQTLEYLDIVAQRSHMTHYNDFKTHHLESLPSVQTVLSMDRKAAFLSVMGARYGRIVDNKRRKHPSPLPLLDQHVLVCIFDFAAPSVTRRVYFREYDFFDTGRDYMPI